MDKDARNRKHARQNLITRLLYSPRLDKKKKKKKKHTRRVQLPQSWLTKAYPDRIMDEIGFDSNRGIIIIPRQRKANVPFVQDPFSDHRRLFDRQALLTSRGHISVHFPLRVFFKLIASFCKVVGATTTKCQQIMVRMSQL